MLFLAGNLFAQDSTSTKKQYRKGQTNQTGFIDADGDGIPNGRDEDFVRTQDDSRSKGNRRSTKNN